MMKFIENPNLPESNVKTVICGTDDKNILAFFEEKGIEIISSERNNLIDSAVSEHADMAAVHLGNKKIVTDKNQTVLIKKLRNIGMTVFETKHDVAGEYPNDVKLNFTVLGKTAIGCFRFADENLKRELVDFNKINVNQGYCKCSVLVVCNNALITDDISIYRKAGENGFDCLSIEKGDVSLPGHEYGFIGGASGKISKNTIVFFGDIRKHRNFHDIENFIKKYNCSFVCTDENELRDIGGIIPIIETD